MRCTVTQLARKSVGLCPLSWFVREGIRVITQQSSKHNYKNNSCTQFACDDVGLWPFYNSSLKKRQIVLQRNFLKRFKEITSALLQHLQLNYVSHNVKVDSLTFITFQENYQTALIYFYLDHVTPLNKAVPNYCVN